MPRSRTVHRCAECGATSATWVGRCPGCGGWGTLAEELDRPAAGGGGPGPEPEERPMPIAEVAVEGGAARPTGLAEVDRVLGGGFVPGSVTLLGGEPGIGKSTLLLQLAAAHAAAGEVVLYVSAEESPQQVRLRAERLGALRPRLWLAAETSVAHVGAHVEEVRPDLLVVDSIQTVAHPELGSAPGSVGQVRESASHLVRLAKARAMATVLVGHVTKDGALAGPRVLEHLVDTVLAFEGDRHHALRLVRAVKHRYGSTSELGLFEMGEAGLAGVPDASALFLADRRPDTPGSVVLPTLEGHRPLLVEVQALLAASPLPAPRRSAQGLDGGRLALLLAVLDRRAGRPCDKVDVHALVVGGARVVDPGADLALALAIVSAADDAPLPPDLVACGEVGLGGELRQVAHLERRLAEAARLGFTQAIVPASAPEGPAGIRLHRAGTVAEAIAVALTLPEAPPPAAAPGPGPGSWEAGTIRP